MKVLGHDPYCSFPESAAEPVKSLDDLLTQSDLTSLHVNYHAGTRHLINRQALAHLKPGAILINTSRCGVVEEAALLEALQSGRLAGAGLDVVDGEPAVAPSHPLVAYARAHDNLLITPHLGGNTRESFEKTEVFLAQRVHEAWGRLSRARIEVCNPLKNS
jgi:D-3-phosphoglycerate dehydrogenase / 2-oxoglutarate reductase